MSPAAREAPRPLGRPRPTAEGAGEGRPVARARAGELEGAREAERREELQGHPASPRSEAEAREGGRERERERGGRRRGALEEPWGRAASSSVRVEPRRALPPPRVEGAGEGAACRRGEQGRRTRERAGGEIEDADGGKKII